MLTFACAGCGRTLPAADSASVPFRCPSAQEGDDIDHVLRRTDVPSAAFPDEGDANPFIRYREFLAAHALAIESGMSDASFVEQVRDLDRAIADVSGTGFAATPFSPWPALAAKLGCGSGEIRAKDETLNVGDRTRRGT